MKSKKTTVAITLFYVCALLLLASCKVSRNESILITVPVESGTTRLKPAGAIRVMGFTRLDVSATEGIGRFRGISKVLFDNGRIIVFDNVSDFQNIWHFDAETGMLTGKLALEGGERQISDIALDAQGNTLCLTPGKRCFQRYDRNGNLSDTRLNGVLGDGVLAVGSDRILVYNEYSATDISGYHQLIYFDEAGNVLRRQYPYSPELDNIAYSLSGFIAQSDEKNWFSPPFCDTVYALEGYNIIPRYVFDFGGKSVPEGLRRRKIQSGWDLHDFAYLSESFLKIGDYILFDYFMNQKMHLAFYNEQTETLGRLPDLSDDCLGELLQYGQIACKDANTFALALSAVQIRKMVEQQKIDLTAMERCHPSLALALRAIAYSDSRDPVLLYLAFAP